jgi:membrane protease YdiL (CAAX protease family)
MNAAEPTRPRGEAGILLLALTLPTALAWLYFVVGGPWLGALYPAAKAAQFVLPLVWLAYADRGRLRAVRVDWSGWGWGLALGLFTLGGMLWLYVTQLRGHPWFAAMPDEIRAKLAAFGLTTPGGFIVLAAFLALIHSFLEEYYWRWFVHDGLRRHLPYAAAVAASSLGFMAHHVVVLDQYLPGRFWTLTVPLSLGVAAGGACWAWLYDRCGSLAGPWVAHVLADVALMVVGYDLLFGL